MPRTPHRSCLNTLFALLTLLPTSFHPASAASPETQPLSPESALQSFHLRPGFQIELVAAEPLVQDPVAIDWDEHGRLWVAEMADYPLGIDGKGTPGGRVRILTDSNHDGSYDQSTVFLDGLRFPTGLLTWRKGVLITAAPDILYAEDTDGDGKADVRRVLYTGFREGNQQLRVNGLRWGFDQWIYCASSWSGGIAQSITTQEQLNLAGRDLRIRPDQGLVDAQSGVTQFGRNRNDWGDWFGVNNSYPLWHFPLPDQYLRRNPHLAVPPPTLQLAGQNPKIYPAKPPEKRFHSFQESGRFTSACSTMVYRDQLLFGSSPHHEHVFVCEPFHNLVHHELLTPSGLTFQSTRPPEENQSEFLASVDRWFRPVMVSTGPDGALWVVDMYRYIIEHPEWLPPEGKAELAPFYRLGEDRGRIYRIRPKASPPQPLPTLNTSSAREIAQAINSPNGWLRDKAQQWLLWNQATSTTATLEKVATSSPHAAARLQALCTLEGLGTLRLKSWLKALQDPHPGVRRQALRISESFTSTSHSNTALNAILKKVQDPDAKVRQQLAFSLGQWSAPAAGRALASLLTTHAEDPYMRASILSSALPHLGILADSLPQPTQPISTPVLEAITTLALSQNRIDLVTRSLNAFLQQLPENLQADQLERLTVILDAVNRHSSSADSPTSQSPLQLALHQCSPIYAQARLWTGSASENEARRIAAMPLLGREKSRTSLDAQQLASLLIPRESPAIQHAAARRLGQFSDPQIAPLLLQPLPQASPDLRQTLMDQLFLRENWILQLLQEIASGKIPEHLVDAPRRERLLKHKSAAVQELCRTAFQRKTDSDRSQVVARFQPALQQTGHPSSGAQVFQRICANCHKLGDVGREIGPNLKAVSHHPPEKLLVSILDPSREMEPRFLAYTCTLRNGEEYYGIISSESATSVRFRLLDGSEKTVFRSEIQSLQSSQLSLMPNGLENSMSPAELADLIAYIKARE